MNIDCDTRAFVKRTELCVLPKDSQASRYGFNDYRGQLPGAVSKMIDSLQWENLLIRSTEARPTLLYKIN